MTSLPKVPIKGDPETRRFLEAVRDNMTSNSKEMVTVSDLKSQTFWVENGITPPQNGNGVRIDPPTVPLNLAVSAAFENIVLNWDFVPYGGHAWTRVYRNTTNNFNTAEVIANVNGTVFSDPVGAAQSFYYWVSNVNLNGVESPPNAVSGTLGQTSQSTQYVLNVLNGAITEGQLFESLGERIDLIDAAAGVPGSVNARIQTNVDPLKAQYTVKIDNNGYVAGFGLASEPVDGTPVSSFIVRSDKFSIASPSGPGVAPAQPFTVITTPTVINGVTIPPGVYINSAFIQDASISSAKIGGLIADKITAGKLKVALGLDGDLNVGTGRIVFDTGTYMKVQGLGFGSSNQFIEWFGPKLASFSLCTEANAIAYIKTNGDAYFGGALSAGTIRNAARTTTTEVPAEIIIGPFSSNGNPKTVVLSYTYSYGASISDEFDVTGTPSATVLLERSFDGTNWTTLSTLNVTGNVSGFDGFGAQEPGIVNINMSGSTTFTDNSGAGTNYRYRGRLTTRTLPTVNSSIIGSPTINQSVSVTSTEE